MTTNTLYLVLFWVLSLFDSFCFGFNCNSSDAFVEIASPRSLQQTLISARSSFSPLEFESIPATEVVLLNSSDNNGCLKNPKDLSTNVNNKIVLIWYGNTNCSEEYKALVLQENGALAVLIANDEGEDIVDTLTDTGINSRRRLNSNSNSDGDDSSTSTSDTIALGIVAREISEEDGWIITNYLEGIEQTITNDSQLLTIEIGCFGNGYPSSVCVVDGTGSFWYADGEYEQQAADIDAKDNLYNNLPIFKKEGYLGMNDDLYMFATNESEIDGLIPGTYSGGGGGGGGGLNDTIVFDFRWVISWNVNDKTSDLVAFCSDYTEDPGKCDVWLTTNTSKSSATGFSFNFKFWVNDSLCKLEETYVCMESDYSRLSGIDGTYQLITEAFSLWIREPRESDLTPAYLLYTYNAPYRVYQFLLVDAVDHKASAYCTLGSKYNKSEEFGPYLCSPWWAVRDSTTNDNSYYKDTTSPSIATKGVCDDYNTQDATNDDDTDSDLDDTYMCLSNHTLKHTFLQGEYEILDDVTTASGRNVWRLVDGSVDVSFNFSAYIWYYGDVNDDILWWVIAVAPPNIMSNPPVYAYCPAMTQHPSDCDACWFFYFNGDWDPDCVVSVKCAAHQ